MHRFYVRPQDINDQQVWLDLEQSRHIDRVLRLGPGDRVNVFDGLGREYEIQLNGFKNGRVEGEIIQLLPPADEPSFLVNLVQGIAKGEKMDFIIQKAVELGTTAIYPFFSQHAVVKLENDRVVKKQERWQAIAREACKQCRRSRMPNVYQPCSLQNIIEIISDKPAVMLYEKETRQGLKELLADEHLLLKSEKELFLIIGPEGGFASDEVEMARSRGVMIAGLGPRILRTETAALAALTIALYELSDLGSGKTI